MSASNIPIGGSDSTGKRYANAEAMWKAELQGDLYDDNSGWYGKAISYWKKTPATVNGVLGGMEHVHDPDIKESRVFIESLPNHGTTRALDCGAGIGRISKALLTTMYATTDLLEPVEHMLEKAKEELAGRPTGEFILSSMENAQLPENTYDLIVIQWAAIYLTDNDFVTFFNRCKRALTPQGYIFFKENVSSTNAFLVDKEDSSLTRSDKHYKLLFIKAQVEVKAEKEQTEWPDNLMTVKMYALK